MQKGVALSKQSRSSSQGHQLTQPGIEVRHIGGLLASQEVQASRDIVECICVHAVQGLAANRDVKSIEELGDQRGALGSVTEGNVGLVAHSQHGLNEVDGEGFEAQSLLAQSRLDQRRVPDGVRLASEDGEGSNWQTAALSMAICKYFVRGTAEELGLTGGQCSTQPG